MPNRADHSVKMPQRHRRDGVKTYAMIGGIIVAVIGALAAMYTGGRDGMALGAGVLTTIIFSQIISPRRRQLPAQETTSHLSKVTDVSASEAVPGEAPVLVLNVSALGRVRTLSGNTDWFQDFALVRRLPASSLPMLKPFKFTRPMPLTKSP